MLSSSRIHPTISILALLCFALILADRFGSAGSARGMVNWLFETAVALGAVALLLGILNVGVVHVRRIRTGGSEWLFSLFLVLCLAGTLAVGLVSPSGVFSPLVGWLFDYLIAPGQMALFALLPCFLAVAAWRYLRVDRAGGGWLLAGTLLMLLMQMPASANPLLGDFAELWEWLIDGPLTAVLRGVLLGAALTMVAVAVRLLLGRQGG